MESPCVSIIIHITLKFSPRPLKDSTLRHSGGTDLVKMPLRISRHIQQSEGEHKGEIPLDLNHVGIVCLPLSPSRRCVTATPRWTSVLIQWIYQTAIRLEGHCFKLACESRNDGGGLDRRAITARGTLSLMLTNVLQSPAITMRSVIISTARAVDNH